MSDEPKTIAEPQPTEEEIATFQMLEGQRRALIEQMRKAVATFMQIVKGGPPPPSPKPG